MAKGVHDSRRDRSCSRGLLLADVHWRQWLFVPLRRKTLAREAAVDRTACYGTRPYAHLRKEFEHRLRSLHATGDIPDPRDAQIERLKTEITKLKARLARSDIAVDELTDFRTQALARLAAQHGEIVRLRGTAAAVSRVTRLPTARTTTIGSCS